MVTNDPDKYFMENFSEMKKVLNHGYRCLLHIAFMSTQTAFMKLDMSKLKFDYKEMVFTNLKEVFDDVFAKQYVVKLVAMSHECGHKDEDITKWDPNEPFFQILGKK